MRFDRLFMSCLIAAIGATSGMIPPARAGFHWANPRPAGNPLNGVDFESASTGYAAGAMGTTLRTIDGGLTWQVMSDAGSLSPQIEDLIVLANGDLLAAADAPGLYRSTDGGASWSPVANPANGTLRNLFALDATTIFAVGDNGRVIRSTDGGASFTARTSLVGRLDDQYWRDAQNGYVIGDQRIRRTTDGGQTWLTIPGVPEGGLLFGGDVRFLDASNGWIVTDFDAYRTTDGGSTWVDLNHPFNNAPIYQDECLPLDLQTRIVASNGEGAEIWKTTNGGANWTKRFALDGLTGITDLERLADGTIIAVSTGGDLLRSTDDGDTWSDFTVAAGAPQRAPLNAIDIIANGTGFAGGLGSGWMATTDAGQSWFDPPANPGLREVYAVKIRDPLFILAGGVGTNGQSDVRRSTDGGATWTTHSLSATYAGYPQGFAALPDGTCFCATMGGTGINYVFRSTDGGATWHLRNNGLPTTNRWCDIQFFDPQTGYVCGGDSPTPYLYRTTDGGANWTSVGSNGLAITMIQDMHWLDASNGIIVGDSRIQRTTNGGATWTTVATGGWSGLDFRDASYGIATEMSAAVQITTDGGATWTRQILPESGYPSDVAATASGYLVVGTASQALAWMDDVASVETPDADGAGIPTWQRRDRAECLVWPNPLTLSVDRTVAFRVEGALAPIREAILYDTSGRRIAQIPVRSLEGGFGRGAIRLDGLPLSAGAVRILLRDEAGRRYMGDLRILP